MKVPYQKLYNVSVIKKEISKNVKVEDLRNKCFKIRPEGKSLYVARELSTFDTIRLKNYKREIYFNIYFSIELNCIITYENISKADLFFSIFKRGTLLEGRTIYYYILEKLEQSKFRSKEYKAEYDSALRSAKIELQRKQQEDAYYNKLSNTYRKIIKNNKIVNDNLEIEIKNVTAEDIQAEGDDIFLGDLKYHIPLFEETVKSADICLVDSTEPAKETQYAKAYHPHQITNKGECCFGSMTLSIEEALQELDVPLLKALLDTFSRNYNSEDEAGETWKIWAGISMENKQYVESRDDEYPEDEVIWSDYLCEYLHIEDAVECYFTSRLLYKDDIITDINGDNVDKQCAIYSSHYSGYIYEGDAVFCEQEDDHYLDSEVTQAFDGSYVFDENAVELEDGKYAHVDLVKEVENEEGDIVYVLID